MDAIVVSQFGGPDSLKQGRADRPLFRPNQMIVRVAACGVCGHDLLNRAGHFASTRLPAILGHEIAGTVDEVGALITGFKIGDRVALMQRQPCGVCRSCRDGRENLCRSGDGFYGEQTPGGYGQYVAASERNAVLLPIEIPFHIGAVLSCAVGTGFRALLRARVRVGDMVVITGASGGVGINTVQIARLMGLNTVAITASDSKVEVLRAAGADHVIVAPDFKFHDQVRALSTGKEGAAAVIEITGGPTFNSSMRALRPGGRLVLVGNVDPGNVVLNPAVAILKEIELIGSAHAVLADLRQIVELVKNKRLSPVIASTMPVEEAAAAHRKLENRLTVGRIVLTHG